jgi:hypothetical protein
VIYRMAEVLEIPANHLLAKAGKLPRATTHYQFNMITPRDYGKFFTKLREGELTDFRSELDVVMAKAAGATSS